MTADEKMKNGNFLQMTNTEIVMTKDFSSHNCKLYNFTQNPQGYIEGVPDFVEKLKSKLKYAYATLF